MTEAEALELVAMYTANAHTSFTMYISFTFAYLATAFFVGSRLTNYQAMAASGLYFISATAVVMALIANIQVWAEVAASTATLLDRLPLMNAMLWISYLSIITSIGILACLYFMWDVRHREAE
jgi:hypothetical protein